MRYRHRREEKNDAKTAHPWRRRLVIIVMVTIVLGIIAHWLGSPAVGHQEAVTERLKHAPQTKTTPVSPASTISNPYFRLNLPPGYNQQVSSNSGTALYAQTILKPGPSGTTIIHLQITTLSGGLSNDASYHLRQSQPQTYELVQETVGGSSVSIATRRDSNGGEVVAFWSHAGYEATLAVTVGTGNSAPTDTVADRHTLETLLQAWQWK